MTKTNAASEISPELKIGALEILWKSLALFTLKTTQDPNARHYLWNTVENTIDALDVKGTDEVLKVKEIMRGYSRQVLSSVDEALENPK